MPPKKNVKKTAPLAEEQESPSVAPAKRNAMSKGQRVLTEEIPGPFVLTDESGKETTLASVIVKFYPVSRTMRNEAVEAAALAYQQKYDKRGFLPSIFEKEMAERIIKWWNLPVHVSNGGWEAIEDPDLGDEIADRVGITTALQSLSNKAKEAEDAKN